MVWLINFLILLVVAFFDDKTCREVMGYLYIIQYISFISYIYYATDKKINIKYFFTPTFLTLSYVSLTFGFAALYLNAELGFLTKFVTIYKNSPSFKLVNFYFLICNFILFFIYFKNFKKNKFLINKFQINRNLIKKNTFIVAFIVFFLFSFIQLDASIFGGNGDLSFVPKFLSCIVITFYLSAKRFKYRLLVYGLLLCVFLASNFDSKREIMFLLIAILYVEFLLNDLHINLSIKNILFFILGGSLFMSIIIVASIFRGYGSFKVNTIYDAFVLIPEYIKSDFFLDAIGENLELNYSYGNALNAADLFLEGKTRLLYGETVAKALFVPLPKSIFEYKPRSIVEIYSPLINNGTGEIQPVVIYSEFLWNFSIIFFIPLYMFFWFSEKIYKDILFQVKKNRLSLLLLLELFYITTILQFVRGSGLDLFVVYIIICLPFAFLFKTVNN
ncbi:hypothetical protein [Chryseobacterium indoltheticum]|uniref:hypothetical protein n=1 Tax=Chryseobacterium indoltheticum TaxID=254 RepID=UPI0028E9BE28|nr:hypothetical protein [Chryseobacterium indoltheticum]